MSTETGVLYSAIARAQGRGKNLLLAPADIAFLLLVATLGAFYGELLNTAEPDPLSEGDLRLTV